MKEKINMKNLFNKIKHNHGLMMIICCATPLVILILAIYFLGVSNKYIFWLVILLCPLMHFFMMKYMHEDNKNGEEKKCH